MPPMRKSSPRWSSWLSAAVIAGSGLVIGAPLLTACRREAPAPPAPATTAIVDAALGAPDSRAVPAAAAAAPALPAPPNLPRGKLITLLHSSNLHGEYEAHPLGGLARRASYTKKVRSEVDALVQVDAGDSLLPALVPPPGDPPPAPSEVERRARLIMEGLGKIGLDAFTPGETDLQLGPARLKALAARARVPLVVANLVDARGKPWFTPHRHFQAGGVRIGVFGVVSMDAPAQDRARAAGITVTDPAGAAQGAASLLREQGAEVVIGLFHLAGGLKEAQRIGGDLSAIDVMVLGHGGESLATPELVAAGTEGATLIVAAFERGKLLGRLDLHQVDGDPGYLPSDRAGATPIAGSWAAHQLVRLDPSIVSDERMLAFVKPYIQENRRRAARKLPVGLTAQPGTAGELAHGSDEGWTFASSSACGMCHKPAMDQFQTTSHAFALQTLERKGRERDPSCLRCHATGFERKGGTRNLQTAVSYFANVGCESCHGPSVAHIRAQNKTGTTRKVPASVCLECHRPDQQIAPFDYATAIKEVVGPGHGG
jgi:2',3'-cyclic-nucleotide 2'-phosphodiesterase (5'-nucleotidase family)